MRKRPLQYVLNLGGGWVEIPSPKTNSRSSKKLKPDPSATTRKQKAADRSGTDRYLCLLHETRLDDPELEKYEYLAWSR